MGGGSQLPSFPGEGAGRVYYSFGGAPAQIHINTAQPGVLRYRFINTRRALPRRIAITKAASKPRTAPEAPLCNCSEEERRAGRARGSGHPRPPARTWREGDSAGWEAALSGAGNPGGGERVEGAPAQESSPRALLLPRHSPWPGGGLTPAWLGAACCSWDGGPQRQISSPPHRPVPPHPGRLNQGLPSPHSPPLPLSLSNPH